jgi:hypothetical protein
MKHLSRVLTGVALSAVLGATPVMAQGAEFSLGGGLSLPLSDFGDQFNTGWHGLAAVSFTPREFPLGFQVDGMYQRFSVDDGGGVDVDASSRFIQGTANAVYKFQTAETSSVRPYLIGGVGIYNSKLTGDDVPDGLESETDFGLNAGAGFDFKFGNVGAFVEGRFHNIFSDPDDANFIPISVGVRFGGT